MTDKELVQQRIDELTKAISEGKQSGRTYRIVSDIIEKLFTFPIGSQIQLVDHENNEDSVVKIKEMFTSRMSHDFPGIDFKIIYPAPGVVYVVRQTSTYQEIAQANLIKWKKKLQEME